MAGDIYLFRHGAIAASGCMVGRSDIPLSGLGRAQAQYWSRELAHLRFGAAFASPLARAGETAAIILSGMQDMPELETVPELTEISLGAWDGKAKDWIRQHYPREWDARGRDRIYTAPPGGENFACLAKRVLPAFQRICAHAAGLEQVMVVAHQAVNRVILSWAMAMPLEQVFSIAQAPAALTLLRVSPDGARIEVVECRTVSDALA